MLRSHLRKRIETEGENVAQVYCRDEGKTKRNTKQKRNMLVAYCLVFHPRINYFFDESNDLFK